MAEPDITISIINTNNRQMTLDCLRSVFANTHQATLEVYVVDNACTDGSAEAIQAEFPQVHLIRNERKLGFSTNNNLVFSRATGRYLMLLNDDTVVHDGAFDQMVAFMDAHPEAGACGANLLNPDGTRQQACNYSPHPIFDALRPLSTWLRPMRCDPRQPSEVDCVGGACMVVRCETAEQVGLLDAEFDPLYSEEIEWCHRIRQAGWKIYHLPQAKVVHYGSQTMNRVPLHRLEKLYEKKTLFFRKHYGLAAVWIFKVTLFVSHVAKMLVWILAYPLLSRTASSKIVAHWHVVKRALFL